MHALLIAFALLGAPTDKYTGVVWVYQPGCQPCARMEPFVNKLVIQGKPIVIVMIHNQNDADVYGIRAVPATIVYRKGKVVHKAEYELTESAFRAWLALVGGQ